MGPNFSPDHDRLDKFKVELISRKVEIYSIGKLNLNHKKVEFFSEGRELHLRNFAVDTLMGLPVVNQK